MSLVKGRNGGKGRNNRMHPNEQRMQEDYYSSAYANQQGVSDMASLSIQSPTKSQEEITMTEQTQQDQSMTEITVTETVTKPSTRRALPARQAKQPEVIITPPPVDIRGKSDDVDAEIFVAPVNEGFTDVLLRESGQVLLHAESLTSGDDKEITIPLISQEEGDLVLEPTVLDEPETPVIPEVRKRTIPETRGTGAGIRPSMLPPKVEPTVTVVAEVPTGYTDAGDRFEKKIEASLLGVTASVTMTKPKPGSTGLIFEGRIDLEEAEGVQFWRPIFNRKVKSDDHVPAHCVPVIVRAAQYRNAGLFDPVFLIAIPCTVGDMNDPNVEVSSGEDGTVITFGAE